jgi:hypothetical protein
MVGAHTVRDSASVVDLQAIGDVAVLPLVRKSVGVNGFPVDPDNAIPGAVARSGPQPVIIGLLDLLPEPFSHIAFDCSHASIVAVMHYAL